MKTVNIKSQGHPTLAWLIFLIWPLGAVFYAFKNYRQKWGRNILWAFVTFYGYIFTIPPNSNIDAGAYRDYFQDIRQLHISFVEVLGSLYSSEGIDGKVSYDIFQPLLSFLVAQFTDNYHIFYLFVGLVFGFFFSRNIWLLIEKCNDRIKLGAATIIILLFFIIPPWLIQSVRFNTASLIFIYGVLLFYFNKDKRGLWLSGLSILVHFSFIFPVLLLLFKQLLLRKNNYKWLFWAYVITIPLSILSMEAFGDVASNILPDIFQAKIDAYTSEQMIQRVNESQAARSIFSIVYDYFRPFFMIIVAVILYKNHNKIKLHFPPSYYNFLCFIMFFSVVMNVVGFVPSVYRFFKITFFLMAGFFLVFYQNSSIKISKDWLLVIGPLCVLYAIGITRYGVGFGLTGIEYVFKSPFYLMLNLFV